MEAASAENIGSMLRQLSGGIASGALQATATTALVVEKMQACRVSLDEMHRLSSAFLEDRRESMKAVLGPRGFAMQDVDFIFFPVAASCASTFIELDRTTVFVSLGLMEVLRLAIASAQLDSAIKRLQDDKLSAAALGARGPDRALERMRLMTQYFNASAVLHFKEPATLPNTARLLDAATAHRVDVVLEAVLLFVLLHELGHVDFHRRAQAQPQAPHIVWEFAVAEQMNSRKREEFYADAYAIKAVPEAFALALAHAATFFLHLHNYVDATAARAPNSHPLCVNRIAALYAFAAGTATDGAVGHEAIARAVDAGRSVWMQSNRHFSVQALRRYVETLSAVDWSPVQQALQLLASQALQGPADAGA